MAILRILLAASACASLSFAGCLAPTPVPEPSTWLMMGTAGLSLIALKKFRKK